MFERIYLRKYIDWYLSSSLKLLLCRSFGGRKCRAPYSWHVFFQGKLARPYQSSVTNGKIFPCWSLIDFNAYYYYSIKYLLNFVTFFLIKQQWNYQFGNTKRAANKKQYEFSLERNISQRPKTQPLSVNAIVDQQPALKEDYSSGWWSTKSIWEYVSIT